MNIWTGLLFLEGAVVDASLARELAQDPAARTEQSHENGAAHDAPTADRLLTGTGQPDTPEEKTMNVFKGLLHLIETDPPASPVLIETPRYGAATAAAGFAKALGNRAASRLRFGTNVNETNASTDRCLDAAGCC